MEARKIGNPCKCKLKCFDVIGNEIIERLFQEYWEYKDYNFQTLHLSKLIRRKFTKKQEELGEANTSSIKFTCDYHIHYQGKDTKVCKNAFISIHGITKDRISWLNKKRTDTDFVMPDQRGQHQHHNQIKEDVKSYVFMHIESLPVRSSHYTREINKDKQYIDLPDKQPQTFFNTKYLDRLQLFYPEVEVVKESYYLHLFNTQYNIETKKPRVDECLTCIKFNNDISVLKEQGKDATAMEDHLLEHKKQADIAYLHLKSAKDQDLWNPNEWAVICIDLQKTFLLPKSSIGTHYYLRKLNMYNFCVCEILTETPSFYMWEEFNGKKGSAEIYSCIYKWLKDNILNKNKNERPKKLRIIADNCGGQNKNNNLVLAFLRLIHQGEFDRIELFFF